MAYDISATALSVVLRASNTFPVGLPISTFADDTDPLDIANLEIADAAMGLNGDLVYWRKSNPIPMSLSVVPGSPDDVNLEILADANRAARGKAVNNDRITATIAYPDGRIVTLTGGIMINYNPGQSVASSQRLKSKTYAFLFEGKI